jgi:hypothetical protein
MSCEEITRWYMCLRWVAKEPKKLLVELCRGALRGFNCNTRTVRLAFLIFLPCALLSIYRIMPSRDPTYYRWSQDKPVTTNQTYGFELRNTVGGGDAGTGSGQLKGASCSNISGCHGSSSCCNGTYSDSDYRWSIAAAEVTWSLEYRRWLRCMNWYNSC